MENSAFDSTLNKQLRNLSKEFQSCCKFSSIFYRILCLIWHIVMEFITVFLSYFI